MVTVQRDRYYWVIAVKSMPPVRDHVSIQGDSFDTSPKSHVMLCTDPFTSFLSETMFARRRALRPSNRIIQ